MDDEQWRRPLAPYDLEQRRLIAESDFQRKKLEEAEVRERARLESDPKFGIMLTARELHDAHLRQFALTAAAKELAAYPGRSLSIVAENAVEAANNQEALERKQEIERDAERQRLRGPRPIPVPPRQPDYFVRNEPHINRDKPDRQPLGKYQPLDDLTRQLRDESDRRQTPPVEHHRQIDREVKNPDYRATATEITSSAKRQRDFGQRDDRPAQESGNAQDQARSNPGRGGRSG